MLKSLKLYVIIGLLGSSIIFGGATFILNKQKKALQAEVNTLSIARDHAEKNLSLVTEQLNREREANVAANIAREELREVPDVIYSEELPAPVTNLLRDFNQRMRGQE